MHALRNTCGTRLATEGFALLRAQIGRAVRCKFCAEHAAAVPPAGAQVQKLEALQAKQAAVLRRKTEEAEAARRRLKARAPLDASHPSYGS